MGRIEQEFDDLRRELGHHEELLAKVERAPNILMMMEAIATELGVILDGAYTEQQILNLAKILTNKLHAKRIGLIIPINTGGSNGSGNS